MKKILITGEGSYIGQSFQQWVKQWSDEYEVHTVGTMHDEWKNISFEGFDVVFHVAAIVHKKEKADMEKLYFSVNCDLAVSIAKKAKQEGVNQFVFLSSMSVYGLSTGTITYNTKEMPNTFYGRSKLKAEHELEKIESSEFHIAMLRPPMVYGQGCKGNYVTLSKLAKMCLVFPDLKNERSMIYIDNLCECIRLTIDNKTQGVIYSQNREYVSTSGIVREICDIKINMFILREYLILLLDGWEKIILKSLTKFLEI